MFICLRWDPFIEARLERSSESLAGLQGQYLPVLHNHASRRSMAVVGLGGPCLVGRSAVAQLSLHCNEGLYLCIRRQYRPGGFHHVGLYKCIFLGYDFLVMIVIRIHG